MTSLHKEVLLLFRVGMDTVDIAEALGLTEAMASRLLSWARELERRK